MFPTELKFIFESNNITRKFNKYIGTFAGLFLRLDWWLIIYIWDIYIYIYK